MRKRSCSIGWVIAIAPPSPAGALDPALLGQYDLSLSLHELVAP